MEQGRLEQTCLGSKIERNFAFEVFGLQSAAPLPAIEVGRERHLGHRLIDRTDPFAEQQATLDQPERCFVAVA